MAIVGWLAQERTLSQAALTVQAQSIDPTNTGALVWPAFFPRKDVPSVDLTSIQAVENRFVSDRREWGARGRRIPKITPITRPVSIVPIEANDAIGEYEMQKLKEAAGTNQEIFRRMAKVSISDRVDELTKANYRRLEIDCNTAWALGTITQKNPETGTTFSVTVLSDATRYVTASPAWSDPSISAYDAFLAAATAARANLGSVVGARMKIATYNAILTDAPDMANSVLSTPAGFEARVSADLGFAFRFSISDETLDIFNDGGTATTATAVWTASRVAFIPAGGVIGYSAFAPVVRAMDLVAQVGQGPGIDTNGQTVYYAEANNGRQLDIEVQVNALPVPDPNKIYVVNAGV